jgi:protein tyrosine phosphatase
MCFAVFSREPEPVAIDSFVEYAKKMSQDSNYLYACEYMLLTKLSAKNTNITAELPDNRSKNRYTDILPYDNSRVKLIPDSDVAEGDCSDYINASYMPGFNSKREYIAAQGPMRSTVDDFWLMIWQQKVSMIVMVTNLSERGREKCEQYWPEDNEPLCYGNINVLLKSELLQDFYVVRVLEVSIESEKRQVFQYHFLTWPDFGVPEDMDHILTFVKDIRDSITGSAPLLVHCSAGVGRTGTFIVVDHLLQLIKKESSIDLFHLVLDLRQHRPKMIQAESQYVFAHECIKMAIEKGLHRGSMLYIAEDEQANGDCLYANACETASEVPLYANASEIHEQSV